jgi:hypothetical protein
MSAIERVQERLSLDGIPYALDAVQHVGFVCCAMLGDVRWKTGDQLALNLFLRWHIVI